MGLFGDERRGGDCEEGIGGRGRGRDGEGEGDGEGDGEGWVAWEGGW